MIFDFGQGIMETKFNLELSTPIVAHPKVPDPGHYRDPLSHFKPCASGMELESIESSMPDARGLVCEKGSWCLQTYSRIVDFEVYQGGNGRADGDHDN